MKKFLLSAFAVLAMGSSAFAADVVTYVTNATEMKNALKAAYTQGAEDCTTIIICKSKNELGEEAEVADNSVVINTGSLQARSDNNILPVRGKLVIKSNQTDIDNLPQFQTGFDYQDPTEHFSMFFENVSLQYRSGVSASSGQIIYWEKMTMDKMQIDSIVVRNCEITNCPRTFFRTAPTGDKVDADNNPLSPSKIQYFEISGCKIHNMNQAKGNNWALNVIGSMPVEMRVQNNMIYDIPYSKGLLQMAYITNDGTAPKIYITNNTILAAKAKYDITPATYYEEGDELPDGVSVGDVKTAETSSNNGFCLINAGDFLDNATEYYVMNNLFQAPKEVPTDVTDWTIMEGAVDLLVARQIADGVTTQLGSMDAEYNYFDSSYKVLVERTGTEDYLGEEESVNVFDYTFDSSLYYDAAAKNYIVEKGNSGDLYTKGSAHIEDFHETPISGLYSCIGADIMYVDKFPTDVKVNVTVEGTTYANVTIQPKKDKYFIGDDITVTLTEAGNKLLTLCEFAGWSDDETNLSKSRSFTLDEKGLDLVAKYADKTPANAISIFTYETAGSNVDSYKNDFGGVAAEVTMMIPTDPDEDGTYEYALATAADKNFQTRAGKFGEDPEADRVNVISRRTSAAARATGLEYAVYTVSTKGYGSLGFSCYVGTDNAAPNVQLAQYSLDGENWTTFATDTLSKYVREAEFAAGAGQLYGWMKLEGSLPAACENKDVVKIRVIGDLNNTLENMYIYNSLNEFDPESSETFEYIAATLITGKKKAFVTDLKPLNVQKDVVYLMTAANTTAEIAKGWLMEGDGSDPKAISKKATIVFKEVEGVLETTETTQSAANVEGVTLKETNRNYYMAVVGITSAKFYFSYNNATRYGVADLWDPEAGVAIEQFSAPNPPVANTTGVAEITGLDPNKVNYLRVHSPEGDLGWYAVKFTYGEADGINEVFTSNSASSIYSISGMKVAQPVKKGIYVINGVKVVK